MANKITVLIAFLVVAAASALPVDNAGGSKAIRYNEFQLSGANGTFSYPGGGNPYYNNERVLITAGFPEDTIFILESIDSESGYDTLQMHKWVGDDLVLDQTFSGYSLDNKYFLPEGNFLLTFESDGSNTRYGFKLRWAPLETFLQTESLTINY